MNLTKLFELKSWEFTIQSRGGIRDLRYKIQGNYFQLIFTLFRIVTRHK